VSELQRLVLDYRTGELVMRCLYRTHDGPNPGTKGRTSVVSELARAGLEQALEALGKGDVTICGTSGFTEREDILLAVISLDAPKTARRVKAKLKGA
jgi:hypothetical protein